MMRNLLLMTVILALMFSSISCESNTEEIMTEPATTSSSKPAGTAITISDDDIEWLAIAISSEAGSVYDGGQWVRCTDEERAAVGWTIVNRLKAGTYDDSIKDIVTAQNQYAHNQQPTSEINEVAEKLLKGGIDDMTEGATHFFSPISMPKEGESTSGFDTGGGLHAVTGIDSKVYFPSWAETMNYVGSLKNVRPAYFMFYRSGEITLKPEPTTAEEETPGTVIVDDFSVAISDIERDEDKAILRFVITKVTDTEAKTQQLPIVLIDNHDNEYTGKLNIDIGGASDLFIKALPKGFVYVEVVQISMPKLAPIETVRLGQAETAFQKIELGKPQFPETFGELGVTEGDTIQIGKWLVSTLQRVEAGVGLGGWRIPFVVQNQEYSPRNISIKWLLQREDGTIASLEPVSERIDGLTKIKIALDLPLAGPFWQVEKVKQLLLIFEDESAHEEILRILPISIIKALPPSEPLRFAYARADGIYTIDLDGRPRKLVNSEAAFGTEFAWHPTGTKLYYISKRGFDIECSVVRDLGNAMSEAIKPNFGGRIGFGLDWTSDGNMIAIGTDASWTAASGIFVINADAPRLLKLTYERGVFDARPAWSPDGTRIAFTRRYGYPNSGDRRIGIARLLGFTAQSEKIGNAQTSGVVNAEIHLSTLLGSNAEVYAPSWFPDSQRIAVGTSEGTFIFDEQGRIITELPIAEPVTIAWALDGTVFLFYPLGANIVIANLNGETIRVIPAGGNVHGRIAVLSP